MRCDSIKYSLPDFVKGSCTKEEMEMITNHLRECDRCSKIVESFQLTFQKIDTMTLSEPDAYFWNNFRIHVNEKIQRKKSGWYQSIWIQKIALPAFVSSVLIFMVTRFIPFQPPDSFSNIIKESEILPILAQSNSNDIKIVEQTYDEPSTFHLTSEINKADKQTTDLAVRSLEKTLLDETSQNDLLASSTELLSDSDIMNNLSDAEASEIVNHLKNKFPY